MKNNSRILPKPAPILKVVKGELDATTLVESSRLDDGPEPFPVGSLPRPLERFVRAVAAYLQLPESLVAICALGCASASLGKGLVVEGLRRAGRRTSANLFLLASAASGSGKSEVIRLVSAPLEEAERVMRRTFFDQERPRLQLELEQCKARGRSTNEDPAVVAEQIETLRRIEEINLELVSPQLIAGNITTEKLTQVLEANGETVFSMSGEARDLLRIVLGRYAKNDETDEGLYLSAYSCEPVRVQRVHRSEVFLEAPCMSVLWLVQPDMVMRVIESGSLTEGGLLPRFLIAHTNAQRQRETGQEPPVPDAIRSAYHDLITALVTTYRNREGDALVVQPHQEAIEEMRAFHNSTIHDDGRFQDVDSYVARWPENAARIALVLHGAQHGSNAHRRILDADTSAHAIAIQRWFNAEQLRLLSSGREKKKVDQHERALDVIKRKFASSHQPLLFSEIQRFVPLKSIEQTREVISALEKTGAVLVTSMKADNGRIVQGVSPT